MKDIKAKILANEKVRAGYFKMVLHAPEIAKSAKPGQFVQVKCSDGFEPLLRRPLGIHRLSVIGNRLSVIELLYEVVGKGTTLLSKKQRWESIDILGPLGNGWTLPLITDHRLPITILIAGGIGAAPLLFLAEELKKQKIETIVLIGAKTKKEILCIKNFKDLGAEVHIATDDGSYGYKGVVSNLLKGFLSQVPSPKSQVLYACGPHSMLKCIASICKEKVIKCQVSMEEKMACGISACLGCAIKVKKGNGWTYKMACSDGPIFNADEVIWQ